LFEEHKVSGGGLIILAASAFLWGVAYGYAKEKFASREWSI